MHISKPHLERNTLVVNAVNPTAGLLAGDSIHIDVQVTQGARLLLTSPSASRAHRMAEGNAEITQRFAVEADASLEVYPELFIPQAGTRYSQRTSAYVTPGGTFMMWDLVAPGRVAHGEVFTFTSIDWITEVFSGETLAARERYRLAPGDASLDGLKAAFPAAYYGSGVIISPALSDDSKVWREIHGLHAEDTWIGCSSLKAGGSSIRVLAADGIRLRKALATIRGLIYCELSQPLPSLRRAGS